MKSGTFLCFLAVALILLPTGRQERGDAAAGARDGSVDPVDYIRRSLRDHPIVCLAEGGHQAKEPHEFLRRVLGDRRILESVDVILVEFATARHQAVLDAYIRGEDVPLSELSGVWRDTSLSPDAPWDSPLYQELLRTIREGNLGLPLRKRVRVLAGDPPMDWDRITTRDEYNASRTLRDPYVAGVAMAQAFGLGKKVLILFGGAHLPRVPVGAEQDPRNSLTYLILKSHPGSVKTIGFLDPEELRVGDRRNELVRGRLYRTDRHWAGGLHAELLFPEVYSLVLDPKTGDRSWQKTPLYPGYHVRDLLDALVYLGPSSEWEYVPGSFDPERDEAYRKELNRRSLIRFGRPWEPGN